jgi:hypothetical protein
MEAAFKHAIGEYLRAKKDDEAAAVETALGEFLAARGVVKPEPKDGYPVGTILVGQLKWNADPGTHNYMLIITERNGKGFRGVARLDYGPSGDPKRKALYDVDGEITPTGLKYKGDLAGLNEVEGKWANGVLQITAGAANGGTLSGSLRFKK